MYYPHDTEFFLVRQKQTSATAPSVITMHKNGRGVDLKDYLCFRSKRDKHDAMDKYVHKDDYASYLKLFGDTL